MFGWVSLNVSYNCFTIKSYAVQKSKYSEIINDTVLISKSLYLYPNPTKDKIYIPTDMSFSYKIYNMTGNIVLHETSKNWKNIDLKELICGIYVLKITYENNKNEFFKIIKN